tara:strand:- start:143 stop:625 length:483 start_codon:yes stop_codon:yes gene_type:complete
MPNNCNSIIKKIFYTFVICLSASCVSINEDNNYSTYNGKLFLNYNNIEQSSFNIDIRLSNKDSIIQIKKPFYGNVLKINVDQRKNLIFLPTEYSKSFYVPSEINRNFKYWLRQCLLSRNFDVDKKIEKIDFYFSCKTTNNKTNYFIKYQESSINGFIQKK